MEGQLAPLDPVAQLVLELQHLPELLRHRLLEDPVGAAACVLRGVHRDVGVPNQLVAVLVPAEVHHHSHAGIDRELAVPQLERNRHRLD